MEAVRQQLDFDLNSRKDTIIDPNWREQPVYSVEEFMDELAKQLGAHYGLADIRDAK